MNYNYAKLTGCIISKQLSYNAYCENFYLIYLNTARESGVSDTIPVLVSDRIFDTNVIIPGICVSISGTYRSRINDGKHTLYLFADEIQIADSANSENKIELTGYICKPVVYRTTPLGREITEIFIAVNRRRGRADYIPCICWGRNAKYASGFNVGDCISVVGRIQSRAYEKQLSDGSKDVRTAYEVSVSMMEIVTEDCADEKKSE